MRQALDNNLRNALERTVISAREVAEQAVREAIARLGVSEAQAPAYLNDVERNLRVKLRAHARQLGDFKHANDVQEIELLVAEAAYEHWHRMLFARFLEQNQLLMFDALTPLSLGECEELAIDEGFTSAWEYASHLASKMLPQVFRQDSPVFQLELAIEHIRNLENKISSIDTQTFQSQDALGWVYQFWQTKRKQDVNDSGVKIGARELSPVTQLFTEPYMVNFLLDNALGAWWAHRRLTPNDIATAKSEQDLRERASIPGVPLTYLRFVESTIADEPAWQPAAGTFEQWPQQLSELKTLDPCCGSGHFLVAAFLMLVPMRMTLDGLNARDAVDAVLRQNIHGLELDQRCVELAAFSLALEAWRFPNAGGYRVLPELHLACSGLSVAAAKAEWKALGVQLEDAGGKKNLAIALDWLHQTFADAPVLGSLINPRKSNAAKIVQWDELAHALNKALTTDAESRDEEQYEANIVAQGLAKAATLLAAEYNWVITNVPYKKAADLNVTLRNYLDYTFPAGASALETAFVERCLELCCSGGVNSIVLPQNWMSLSTYQKFREMVLFKTKFRFIARLGAGAFETITGHVVKVVLFTTINSTENANNDFFAIDVSSKSKATLKATTLVEEPLRYFNQAKISNLPDSRVILDNVGEGELFALRANSFVGLQNGDTEKYVQYLWEHPKLGGIWELFHMPPSKTSFFDGRCSIIRWESGNGSLNASSKARIQGIEAWGKNGVAVRLTKPCPATFYSGSIYDQSSAVIIPEKESILLATWCFCTSENFRIELEKIDQKRNITNGTFVKVPFNLSHWDKIAKEEFPNGAPEPFTNDPTQWIFHGHPCGSVIWHEQKKITAIGEVRRDNSVMQIAIARLLGYRWPTETYPNMMLAREQQSWIKACGELENLVDDDGITCIPAVRGEQPAEIRLEAMLQAAYGEVWSIHVQNELLRIAGSSTLETWLRDKFFEQHCKLFGQRPFIWQVWDGLKDGFSALINYHKLTADTLDRLIYTYLGDWIRTQEQGIKTGIDGADIRLSAALNLKTELEAIKHGEAATDGEDGYDIFVRWKPLHEQSIGWNPDLNDGVRLNIRPFMSAKDMGKKGAGVLRIAPKIDWKKDRGTDVETAPWYKLGPQYGESLGARINDHHLTRAEKLSARERHTEKIALHGNEQQPETPITRKKENSKQGDLI